MFSGPLKAAMQTSAAESLSAAQPAPPSEHGRHQTAGGSDCMSLARCAISRRPSSSAKTPAMQAAANSPTLCPITAAGSTPQLRHRRGQGVFEGEHHRLRVARLVQQRAALADPAATAAGDPESVQQLGATVERRAERGLRFVQRAAHAGVLRPLAREQKRDLRLAVDAPPRLRRVPAGNRSEAMACSLSRASGTECATTAARCAKWVRPVLAVKAKLGSDDPFAPAENPRSGRPVAPEPRPTWPKASRYDAAAPANLFRAGLLGTLRRLLQNDVGVGAAESEGTDARPPRLSSRAQSRRLVGISSGESSTANSGLTVLQVQVRRNLPVPQHQDDLDQPGDAGRTFQVPDVRFHRADHQRLIGRRRPPHSADRSASISIGSPKRVPVPCAST